MHNSGHMQLNGKRRSTHNFFSRESKCISVTVEHPEIMGGGEVNVEKCS